MKKKERGVCPFLYIRSNWREDSGSPDLSKFGDLTILYLNRRLGKLLTITSGLSMKREVISKTSDKGF